MAADRKVEALEMAAGIAQGLGAAVVLGCIAWFFGGYKVIPYEENANEQDH
jgi:hypothetical protein